MGTISTQLKRKLQPPAVHFSANCSYLMQPWTKHYHKGSLIGTGSSPPSLQILIIAHNPIANGREKTADSGKILTLGRQDQALGWTWTHHGEQHWLWRGWGWPCSLIRSFSLPCCSSVQSWSEANVCRGDAGLWLSLGNRGCNFPPCTTPRKIIKATGKYTEWPSPFHFEI